MKPDIYQDDFVLHFVEHCVVGGRSVGQSVRQNLAMGKTVCFAGPA